MNFDVGFDGGFAIINLHGSIFAHVDRDLVDYRIWRVLVTVFILGTTSDDVIVG